MSATHGQERGVESASLGAVAHPRRRWIVHALRKGGVLDVGQLASRVAGWERDVPPESVEGDDLQRTMVELIHVDLPVLADADLVEYDPHERTVRRSRDEVDHGSETALPPAVLDALANGRRRMVLTVLNQRVTPLSVTDLACELASRERDVPLDAVPEGHRHAVHVALHHCHLPKLADAGLVLYDESTHEVERSSDHLESIAARIERTDRWSGSHTTGDR